ncbi:MAG: hypothetical protein NC236_01820 [Mycoplasma sp.]|nr:hypothetical protein [Mycoplasma sp.]
MKLIKFNKLWYIALLFIFSILIGLFIFFKNYKIEIYDEVLIKVSSDNQRKIVFNSAIAYKLEKYSKIILKYDNKYHLINVSKIYLTDKSDLYTMNIGKNDNWLIENSTLPATIIYENKPLLNLIF